MRTLLASAIVMMALAGGGTVGVLAKTAGAPKLSPLQRGHCHADETVIYSCPIAARYVSVCAAPGRIAYRFGPLGKPELDIASAPDWSNVHIGRITGGGGGFQNHVRFTAADHDYVVYEAVAGGLTQTSGKRWSGVHVQRGDAELMSRGCKLQTVGTLQRARDFAPAAVLPTLDDADPRFEAWF